MKFRQLKTNIIHHINIKVHLIYKNTFAILLHLVELFLVCYDAAYYSETFDMLICTRFDNVRLCVLIIFLIIFHVDLLHQNTGEGYYFHLSPWVKIENGTRLHLAHNG